MEKSSGNKFWTGTKRRPRPVDWTDPIPLLMEYLYSTANMYASVWQLAGVRDRDEFQAVVDELKLEQPQWEPSGEKVDLSEGDDNEEGAGGSEEDDEALKAELYKIDSSKLQAAQPAEFEKDGELTFICSIATLCFLTLYLPLYLVTQTISTFTSISSQRQRTCDHGTMTSSHLHASESFD